MADQLVVGTPRRDPIRKIRTDRSAANAAGPSRSSRVTSPGAAKRSFRMPELVLGVLLVGGCALGAVLWQQSVDTTTTIVVAARPIGRGTVITAADLRGAQIGGETGSMIAGADAQTLLGQIATVDIAAGMPLSSALATTDQPLGSDEALTSMALDPGEVPPDLAPNDHVRIVVTAPSNSAGATEATLLEATATVWSVDPSQDGISVVVTVRGPLALSTEVAAASAVRLARVDG